MKRIVPAGYEDDDSENEDDTFLPVQFTKIKAQLTCQLSNDKNGSSSKVKRRNDYMLAKGKDKKLGPVFRPQDRPENKAFYVDAVRRNLGLGSETVSEPSSLPSTPLLPNIDVKVTMNGTCTRTPRWIGKADEVAEVQTLLNQHDEVAIDFENNNDHSFLGMTALVQISTVHHDFILDPFPTFPTLKPMLLEIMKNGAKLKIFCGAGNDFLNLRRDFELVPALCLDIQFLDKRMEGLPVTSNPKGLKQLCEKYLHVNIPKGETNRDWRRRPLPMELTRYAQGDTYYTMAVYQEMKRKIFSQQKKQLLNQAIEDTQAMMTTVLKKQVIPPPLKVHHSENKVKVLLEKWRHDIGKLVDDKPVNVLSDSALTKLATTCPSDHEDIKKIIGSHAGLIKGNILGLARLLREKQDFWSKTECNKCGVKGHCAIQCIQLTNRSVEKERYKTNPEAKRKQNQRRRRNKARNLALRGCIN